MAARVQGDCVVASLVQRLVGARHACRVWPPPCCNSSTRPFGSPPTHRRGSWHRWRPAIRAWVLEHPAV